MMMWYLVMIEAVISIVMNADAYGSIYADQFLPRQQQTSLHPSTTKRAARSTSSGGVYEGTPSTIDPDLPVTAVGPSVHFTISDPSSYLYFNDERVRFDPTEVHLEEGKLRYLPASIYHMCLSYLSTYLLVLSTYLPIMISTCLLYLPPTYLSNYLSYLSTYYLSF
jgi:hypothetical protein